MNFGSQTSLACFTSIHLHTTNFMARTHWISPFSTIISSSLFSDNLNSIRNLDVSDSLLLFLWTYLCLGVNAQKHFFMLWVLSEYVDVYLRCYNMCWRCTKQYQIYFLHTWTCIYIWLCWRRLKYIATKGVISHSASPN